ncbi:MAG: HAMP domain-containing histidine kinase [Pseudobdellovibrionaceae bacterium]|nr:HAMP domain-containing histidine kinase [Pseudobdellovibrionaceae bacterium]
MRDQKNNSLEFGRERTDKSLRVERKKTDDSLVRVTKESEQRTDDAISTSRTNSDDDKYRERLDSDNFRNADPSDNRFLQERQTADDSLGSEPCRIDAYFADERKQKTLVEHVFFTRERQETDKDLNSEREETDVEVLRSEEILNYEREDHLATKKALSTRDEFLAIVGRDLTNPVASISMTVDLLRKGPYNSENDDLTRRFLDLIGRNAEEALRLISDLVDMERIASGKLSLDRKPYNLNEAIQNAVEKFKYVASEKNSSIRFKPSLNHSVAFCDPDRIAQVLSNLVSNAIKFTPKGGEIILSVNSSQDEFLVSVEDNGPGIQAEEQTLIFERFLQTKKADKRGLGLGLHISKMIVEGHEGKIWVDSRYGQGSTFYFTVPKYLTH